MTQLLQELVTSQAERRPEATALVWKGDRISYGELEARSNQLAWLLRDNGCGRGSRVGLLIPKSPTAIIAILGVLKAEAVYVPLDPAGPASRLARIIDSCDDRWILAAGPVAGMLGEVAAETSRVGASRIGWLDANPPEGLRVEFTLGDLAAFPVATPTYRVRPQDAAHILFTSGSTGQPKGVVIPHETVSQFLSWAVPYFGIGESDRLSGHPPLHFDLSTFDIFGAFAAGAELHMVPPELNLLPQKLAGFINDSELTQWFSVPSVLNFLAKHEALSEGAFPSLERVIWCGEVLPTAALIYWMRRVPHASFTNLYGPTEATIASSFYTVRECPQDEHDPIPIGTPCAGEELLVLSDDLGPVASGEVGDLYIRGAGLSPGYWRDPEKTRQAFLPNPAAADPTDRIYRTGDLARWGDDGLLYFLGRKDSQIKSRGYRIELGEIETAVNAVEGIREGAVVALQTDGFEGTAICCAYVPGENAELAPAQVRKKLTRVLPGYMLPARWLVLDALPRNANGKIDRPALHDEFQSAAAAVG